MVQQMNLGINGVRSNYVLRADYLHNFGTHFIIGRRLAVSLIRRWADRMRFTNLESSVNTKYDGLLLMLRSALPVTIKFRAPTLSERSTLRTTIRFRSPMVR